MRRSGYIQIMGDLVRGLVDPAFAALHANGEADTAKCGHCQRQVILKPFAPSPHTCRTCWRLVCEACAKTQACQPFEEEIERKLADRGF